jgi:hypothetical protein
MLMQNWGEDFSNRQFGKRVYIRVVMIIVLEQQTLSHQHICFLKTTMFPHRNTCTSTDRKTNNHITMHLLVGDGIQAYLMFNFA